MATSVGRARREPEHAACERHAVRLDFCNLLRMPQPDVLTRGVTIACRSLHLGAARKESPYDVDGFAS
jgi:hypothetical protein